MLIRGCDNLAGFFILFHISIVLVLGYALSLLAAAPTHLNLLLFIPFALLVVFYADSVDDFLFTQKTSTFLFSLFFFADLRPTYLFSIPGDVFFMMMGGLFQFFFLLVYLLLLCLSFLILLRHSKLIHFGVRLVFDFARGTKQPRLVFLADPVLGHSRLLSVRTVSD